MLQLLLAAWCGVSAVAASLRLQGGASVADNCAGRRLSSAIVNRPQFVSGLLCVIVVVLRRAACRHEE